MLTSAPTASLVAKSGQRLSYYPLLMQALVFTSVLGLGVSYGKIYLFHVVLAIAALANLDRTERGHFFDGVRLPSRYHGFFFFMFVWFAIGLFWSWDRAYTGQYLFYIACGGGLLMLVVKYVGTSANRFRQLFEVAKWAFVLDMAAGVMEATTPFRLPISPLTSGAELESLDDLSSEAMSLVASMPTGFHWNPNNYAMVVCLLLPFFLFHKKLGWALVGIAATVFLAVSADSRAALVAIVFMLLLLPAFRGKTSWVFVSLAFVACIQLAVVSNETVMETMDTAFQALERYSGVEEDDDVDSIGVRRHLIENGLVALSETYGLGVGGGADKRVQEEMFSLPTKVVITSMHHTWIELLVNGGLVFFVVFVCWYGSLTLQLFRQSRRWPVESLLGYSGRSLTLSLCGLAPAAVAASTAIYVLPMYLLFGMAIAWLNVSSTKVTPEQAARCCAVRVHQLPRPMLRRSA